MVDHLSGATGACEFHSCSQDPRSYINLTTTLGLPDLTTAAERSRNALTIVETEFEGLLSVHPSDSD
jgi:hypothetical protein